MTRFRTHWPRLGLLLLAGLLLAPAVSAQSDVLTHYDIARIAMVGQAEVSPDGAFVAYTVAVPRDPFEANAAPHVELHVYDVERGQSRGLHTGEVSVSGLSWTPDGRIAFRTRLEDDTQTALYVIDPQSGEMTRQLAFGTSIGAYAWSPDGQQIAFVATEPVEAAEPLLPYQPEIYEETYRDRKLWIASGGGEPRMIDLPGTVYQVTWSPDGERLAVAVAPTASVDDSYMEQRVRILDAETGAVLARIENPGKLGAITWSPSGTHLALIAAGDLNDPASGRLLVADAATGAFTDILPEYEGHVTSLVWEDGETIRYAAARGVESVIERVGREGGQTQTLVPAGLAAFRGISVSEDGSVVAFSASTPQHPSELFVMTAADEAPRRVTDTNPWLAGKRLAPQEVIRYEARDGLEIEGLLIRPLDETPGERAPLIVVVHGGPESHYDNGWLTGYSTPGQLAAARGFAVFYPNYRGSTGRGVAFSKTSQGDAAGAEFDDVIDGVDHLIEIGLVDGERVGVTGGSYGGYATAWFSTRHTERFAAGVMFVGISNKISKFGTSDIPYELNYVHDLSWPWDDYQHALERSPIYYAGQAKTPLLILHGKEDPRVHPGQSLELYRHLKLRGEAPVRLVLYPGEGHGNRASTARFDYSLRAMRWFEHYLMGPGGEPPSHDVADLAEAEREAYAEPAGSH